MGSKSTFHPIEGAVLWVSMLGLMLYLVAYSTVSWQMYRSEGSSEDAAFIGIWHACYCGSNPYYGDQTWFTATIAMITVGLILWGVVVVLSLLYTFIIPMRNRAARAAISALLFITFCVILVGIIVYGSFTTRSEWGSSNQSYSFILSVISIIFPLFGSILGFFSLRK